MKITGLKGLFAAAVLVAGLSACHCSANDNTSRPVVNDENGRNVGNDEIQENLSPGSDCNPTNDMYDGVTNRTKTEASEGEKHEEHKEHE